MSLCSIGSLEHRFDLIVDYVFRTCTEGNDKSIPTDMKNVIIKYLVDIRINLFSDDYSNFYCNFYDMFPDISKSTWNMLEIYPKNVKTLSSYQLFPYRSKNASINFYDSHGQYLFKFVFDGPYWNGQGNVCHSELENFTYKPETKKLQILKKIVTSPKFKAFCKEHDIICNHYTRHMKAYIPYIIGFNKFPTELALFLYQQFNQLYSHSDNDESNGSAIATSKQKQSKLLSRSNVNCKLVRQTGFTLIGELPDNSKTDIIKLDIENTSMFNSRSDEYPFLYFNEMKLNNNNDFKFSNFIKNELKLKSTMTKNVIIKDENSDINSNITKKHNNDIIDGEFSIRMWNHNYDNEAYNYEFEFGHCKMGSNHILNIYFVFHESNDKYNDLFYDSCMSLIDAELDIYCINKWGNQFNRKFTKKVLNGLKNGSDKFKRIVRARVLNNYYNQVVTSQKQFDALLSVCDNILQFIREDAIPDPKLTLKMGLQVVYP